MNKSTKSKVIKVGLISKILYLKEVFTEVNNLKDMFVEYLKELKSLILFKKCFYCSVCRSFF